MRSSGWPGCVLACPAKCIAGGQAVSELIVHHLPPAWGLMSISPFCLKLDAFLRIAAIPHQSVVDATPFSAPKGKLPWIEHDGKKLGDSGFIIDYLKTRFAVDPDSALTAEQRGMAVALRRLVEENLYWAMVYDRWMVDSNWATSPDSCVAAMSASMRLTCSSRSRARLRSARAVATLSATHAAARSAICSGVRASGTSTWCAVRTRCSAR